jgi:hypothetical protein
VQHHLAQALCFNPRHPLTASTGTQLHNHAHL